MRERERERETKITYVKSYYRHILHTRYYKYVILGPIF